jgi:DNA-directed RNA polymerase specialized sigma24 family protein
MAIVLRYYGDFSLREVADLLGQCEGTVHVTLHRALHTLRQGLPENPRFQHLPSLPCPSGRVYSKPMRS